MSIADSISPAITEALVTNESLWRLSVEQYHDMARQGILSDGDPVELLDGLLVEKMTISPAHRRATHRVQNVLRKLVPDTHYVASPSPITLPKRSEPEPDVVVARGSDDDYADRHPGPGDVALVVEVSDSSLRRDRGFKKALYAEAALPVYWIVNLIDRRVEVFTRPAAMANRFDYEDVRHHEENDEVPLMIDGREVAKIRVRELLA